VWFLLLGSCLFQTTEYPYPIEGTAWRIEEDRPAEKSEVRVDILTNERECAEAKVTDVSECVPRADRASGEVHLSFRLRDPQNPTDIYRAIKPDQLRVTHDRSTQSDVQLIPHEPVGTGQLYVLVIDGSGSMFENDRERINKVYAALLDKSVVDGFYPPHNPKTGVVLLRFTQQVTGLDGGPPRVLNTREDYEKMVKEHLLDQSGGYTHLYDSLKVTLQDVLEQDAISSFLAVKSAEPAVVLLTDGFNNEAASDTCATNVPRLQGALDVVREIRTSQGTGVRPVVHTVGLGRPYRKGNMPKGALNRAVTARDLCGNYADYRIDPDLEDVGIDHVSLQYLAEAGGGTSFVKSQAKGLAEALAAQSATRYRWYEVWYRVPDAFYHRKSFDVELQLTTYDRAMTKVTLHPNAWLDAPTATHVEDRRWHLPRPFLASLAVLMPALGLITLLLYVGPALFNTRRAIFRRARPRRR
jgi:hypothetical protein